MSAEPASANKLPKETVVKSTTAARVAISSGPAAIAEARKKKKKTSKPSLPTRKTSPDPPHTQKTTQTAR